MKLPIFRPLAGPTADSPGCRMPALVVAVLVALLAMDSATIARSAPADGDVHGNWTVRCEPQPDEKPTQCYIFQNLVLREGGQRVLHVAIGYVKGQDYPIALFTLPLGISIPSGTTVVVDDGERARIPIERCEPKGCRGGVKLGPKLYKAFQEGTEAVVTFHDAEREPVNVSVSLEGFSPGLQALR